MATTTLPARTVSPQAWAKASHTTPSLPTEVDTAVTGIMAELSQLPIGPGIRIMGMTPWLPGFDYCSGVLWASVPHMSGHWRDGDGWIISRNADRNALATCHLRISPAPEGQNVVQHGFCPIRLNTMEVLKRQTWGTDPLRMSSLVIQTSRESSFRTDKMVMSAIRLSHPVASSPQSDRFLELLGRRSMSVFVEDMLRGCYVDSSTARDILRGRDGRYREMMGLIADHAYTAWDTPTNEQDLGRFRNAMGVTSQDEWYPDCLWPYLYNVVMPRPVFEANSRNLEAGIPPIIPHYVTPKHWMFNGRWASPCTGLVFPQRCGINKPSQKITAGLMGKSNLDLPGSVSIWPTTDNPPQEWTDAFVRCIESVGDLDMPLDVRDRTDLVLHESHRIPVAFRTHSTIGESHTTRAYKFVRMLAGEFDNASLELTSITVRDCDASGNEWRGESRSSLNPSTSVADSPTDDGTFDEGYTECADCGNERHEDDMTRCVECEGEFCEGCIVHCPGCDDYTCEGCKHITTDDGGEECSSCGREREERTSR